MHVLVVASGWPSEQHPARSIFVKEQVEALGREGIDIDVVTFSGRLNPTNYIAARRRVKQSLRQGSFDLIHAHFGQTGLVVPFGDLPVVVSFYGSDLEGIVAAHGRYTAKGRVLRAISRRTALRASHTIVLSRRLAERLPRPVRYSVIPLGVDVTVFTPQDQAEARRQLGLRMPGRLVLFAGDPRVPVKRYELAVEAVRRLRPAMDVSLVTVVDRPRSVVAAYMNAADALLVTSRHEGGPLVVKEALACNLPVVSVDVGDVAEWIGDLQGCVLCTDDRPETIAAGLSVVLGGDGSTFDGRSAALRADLRSTARRVISVYEDVVTAKPTVTPVPRD